jgi:bla regulator protein BlaR1
MRPAIDQALLAMSSSLAASVVVKATIVITITLIAARLASRSRASIRHAILAAGFAVLLVLPIASVIAPPVHISLAVAPGSAAFASDVRQFALGGSLAPQTNTNLSSAPTKTETLKFSLFDLLIALWSIGTVIFLAPVIIGIWQIRTLRRTGLPWRHGNSVAITLANELKLRRRTEVLLHESVPGPMTCGVIHPAILFPVQAENWNGDDLHRAIAHELEHVRRADWLTQCLARVVCAAYWFHPLVWIAWRKLTLEAERACDDAVLSRSEATAYAEQLVTLARRLSAMKSPILAMASRSDLTARVNAVLDSRQRRGHAGLFAVAFACGISGLVIATLSPARLVAAQPGGHDRQSGGATLPSFGAASIKPVGTSAGRGGAGIQLLPGRLEGTAPLRVLMQSAYGVQPFQIEGGPGWITSEQYEVDATVPGNPSRTQMYLMLQSLLEDRFHLQFHRETREMPVLALVPARGGLKLPPPEHGTCTEDTDVVGPLANPGARMQPPGQRSYLPPKCGDITVALGIDGAVALGGKVPMAKFAQFLSRVFGRMVIDQTNFSGVFDVKLQFLPDETTPGLPPPPPGTVPAEAASPPIFTALQQLGLKLRSTKAPVEVLVIDRIERPTPN